MEAKWLRENAAFVAEATRVLSPYMSADRVARFIYRYRSAAGAVDHLPMLTDLNGSESDEYDDADDAPWDVQRPLSTRTMMTPVTARPGWVALNPRPGACAKVPNPPTSPTKGQMATATSLPATPTKPAAAWAAVARQGSTPMPTKPRGVAAAPVEDPGAGSSTMSTSYSDGDDDDTLNATDEDDLAELSDCDGPVESDAQLEDELQTVWTQLRTLADAYDSCPGMHSRAFFSALSHVLVQQG